MLIMLSAIVAKMQRFARLKIPPEIIQINPRFE